MKIIPKLQQGGNYNRFFSVYQPIKTQIPQQQSQQYREVKQDNGKLTEKDLFDLVGKLNGLPNETKSVTDHLMNVLEYNKLVGMDVYDVRTLYLQSLLQLNKLADNKASYDTAYSEARKKGALSEPAITPDNKLMVQTEDGKIHAITVEDYINEYSQYPLLTVSNLANMRKYDPNLAYNKDVFSIIENSMGYQEFQNLINNVTSKLGSTEMTSNGMFSVEGKASKGLELLETLRDDDKIRAYGSITAEGLYEYKVIDKNQLGQINALLSYITAALPDSAKVWASVKTKIPNQNKAIHDLVFQYLLAGSSSQHTFDIQYKGDQTNTTSASTKSIRGQEDIEQNTPMKWIAGLGIQNIFTINSGENYSTEVLATTMPLTDSNKKYLGANSTLQQVTQGEYGPVLNMQSVSMGMRRIDPSNFSKVVLTDGKISLIDFPSKALDDGTIVPDLSPETAKAKEQAEREIRNLGIDIQDVNSRAANYNTINDIYNKYKLPPAYNPDGSPAEQWTQFGVINAAASNATLGMGQLDDNELLRTIYDDKIIDNLLEITKEDFDERNFIEWFGRYDHFYNGTVWIPVNSSYIAASANVGMKASEVNTITHLEQQADYSKILTKEKI